jgi:hypothetical protein
MAYALLIGLNYTATPSLQLKGCINDIVHMRNMLIDAYGYPIENITMLRDDSSDPSYLPTHNNILEALTQIVAKNVSQIWIHYSGHGTQIIDSSTYAVTEESGLGDCIVPCDYMTSGYITQNEFFNIIRQIKCLAYITIDACHSGSLGQLKWSYNYIDPNRYSRSQTVGVELSNNQIYMISGCRDSQTSADSFDALEQIPMGAFTDTFITCLRGFKHNISILALYREICITLYTSGFSQTPVLSTSSRNLGFFQRG